MKSSPELRRNRQAAGRHALGVAAAALLAGLASAACGADGGEPVRTPAAAGSSSGPAAERLTGDLMHRSPPVSLRISRIGVSAPVSRLGLRPDGKVEEPPLDRPNLAGWYEKGPAPGELGPSVILGHVDAHRKAAVFYRLKDLRRGDRIEVTRKDGSVATFSVQRLEKVAKSRFPTERVYGEDIDYSSLRLVTCGGSFNSQTRHYTDNVIAYSRLISATPG
ncbi:class F sortase [Actinomadura sp. HBU206391]|uniref:class F sortase n=1 Tax=Actinomadura sp. HBU206391 TaxID=2731692 RepID=UPI00164F9309|nr:class F sortase [Actinomadura sp. HBU206391]MBC6456851.1 class F sortase [Actinomadura sp. HBU206391]